MNGEAGQKTNDLTKDKKKLIYMIISAVAIIALIAGLIYAWFYNQSDMNTLLAIKSPSAISILGPNGNEMSSLDLNYTEDDKNGDTVTVRRVFCVQTAEDYHRLEIAHTTNMKDLQFKLYAVTADGTETVTDGGYTYHYNNMPIAGAYINATDANGYKYADKTYHSNNYNDTDQTQDHAEPVYWLADGKMTTDKFAENQVVIGDKTYYRTYYVCEVSWTEDKKETDIFYILAENAQ